MRKWSWIGLIKRSTILESAIFKHGSALLLTSLLALGVASESCSSPDSHPSSGRTRGVGQDDPLLVPSESQTAHLYLRPSPYSAIYVEVDAAGGLEPDESMLLELTNFLEEHCDKPNGIEIGPVEVLTEGSAENEYALALANMDGPPKANADCAYLYVLLYDGTLLKNPTNTEPHVDISCYSSAVFYDVPAVRESLPSLSRSGQTTLENRLLCHELGHVLGLLHCETESCLMAERLIPDPSLNVTLCRRCEAELNFNKTASDPGSVVEFAGPLLRRREVAYSVFYGPGWVHVAFAKPAIEAGDVLAEMRRQREFARPGLVTAEFGENTQERADALRSAYDDRDSYVRQFARKAAGEARQEP